MTGDPSTETRRDSVGLSTSAQLRHAQRETVELATLLLQAREEVIALAETLSIFDSALRDTRRSLAASQADLTHVEQQLANAEAERLVAEARLHDALADIDALTLVKTELTAAQQAEPCAWLDLAVAAMQERDLARAQLDDAIATFRADKEG